ncbi:DMT family transporter [Pontivivens ytuae]|uniref:DMT family transporter n=1 Tax=Pontivivens ytuae TaxID=2789856 RepID=A0A7S9LSF3_9RHOB|nr:DMT family transporter [Pontivivens ytuae]QPH54452.1 DMT family transporter [Pontivivens ytuae]
MKIAPRWAYPVVFVGVCGHASSEFFAVLSGVSGPEVSVWRYLLGGFGLIVWALIDRDSRDLISPLKAEGWRIVWLSFFGVTLTYLAFHWALDYATVIQVATVVTTIPIFVALANWVVNGVAPGAVKIVTGAMAVIGVVLLLTDGAIEALAGTPGTLFGVLLAVICAALGSFYAVLVKPVMGRHGGLKIIALTMMIGGIGLWLLVGSVWSIWVNPLTLGERPAIAVWSLLILALWNTTITQLLWFGGLAAAPDITRASYLFFLKPVIAAGLAIFILAQYPTPLQVAAILVVTGSVFVEMFWPRLRQLATR